jgi:Ca2+-binding RTX toxin-like protein
MSTSAHLDIGTADDDFLFTSGPLMNVVYGYNGDDTIQDTTAKGVIDSGRDGLFGNAGDDIIYTHAGHDVVGGGDGNDTLITDNQSNVLLRGGSGDDTAIIVVDNPSLYTNHDLSGDETIDLGGHTVKLHRVEHVEFVDHSWHL